MKNFICFSKQFFLQNDFIDTKNAVLTGRPNFSCSITGNYPKKSPQRMQKLFEAIFFKLFPWRGRKQLESPADFFFVSQPNFFCSIFKKTTICKVCKKLSPESFHWNRESSFDNPATFLARFGQKIRSVSKKEKKIETKVFFVKKFVLDT